MSHLKYGDCALIFSAPNMRNNFIQLMLAGSLYKVAQFLFFSRATQRGYSSKQVKHSIVKRILVFKQ